MSIKNRTDDELREKLGYWEHQLERYDNLGDSHAYLRALQEYNAIESELVSRSVEYQDDTGKLSDLSFD